VCEYSFLYYMYNVDNFETVMDLSIVNSKYGDGAGNIVEENSSIFSLI